MLSTSHQAQADAGARSDRRLGRLLLSVALLLAILITAGGWHYYQGQYAEAQKNAWDSLSSIADLKAEAIASWMRERRGDAEVARTSTAIKGVATSSVDITGPNAGLASFDVFRNVYGYAALIVADAQGRIRLKGPFDFSPPESATAEKIQMALHSSQVVVSDLARDGTDAPVLMWLCCPVFPWPQTNGSPVGAVMMVIDPRTFLYPTIQRWPTPSQTGETLLVRRDGDEVVYLNELRHRAQAALNLRIPVNARTNLTATLAAQGFDGKINGVDYRGVPVFAVARKVAGTPWAIVAKVDADEIFAPMRREAWEIGIISGLLLLTAILGIGSVWRQQKLVYVRANESRMRTLIEQAPMAIGISRGGKSVYVNQKFLDLYDYASVEAVAGADIASFYAPEFRERIEERARKQAQGEPLPSEYEGTAQRRDGSPFPIQVVVARVELPDGPASLAFIADITERKSAEEKLRHQMEEVRDRNVELERFGAASTDRELRIIELKKEINELFRKAGLPQKYRLEFTETI